MPVDKKMHPEASTHQYKQKSIFAYPFHFRLPPLLNGFTCSNQNANLHHNDTEGLRQRD